MSGIFLSEWEKQQIKAPANRGVMGSLYWGLLGRAQQRAGSPGLMDGDTTVTWWHCAAEYVTDGAMAWALSGDERIGHWLRDVTLSIARRPVDDWIGPAFRNHRSSEPVGHLETTHLCWAVAVALDLGGEVFSAGERDELSECLAKRGIPMCARWLEPSKNFNNWRSILNSGLTVAAAVLDDRAMMERGAAELERLSDLFQKDGSYGESLQYGNYAALGMVMAAEALGRRDGKYWDRVLTERCARKVRWEVSSWFYNKPLSGWGAREQPRSANFNDSTAMYRPTGDVLLHVAARMKEKMPVEAGLARWLFDLHYGAGGGDGPWDRASFGFLPQLGFMSLPLLAGACEAVTPERAGVGTMEAFDCGDVLVRDAWGGRTIVAIHGGGEALHSVAHLHGDLNSFILVHNRERLLADPGHSCYRNVMHEYEISTQTHNTCTFMAESMPGRLIEQRHDGVRMCRQGRVDEPVTRGARRLLVAEDGGVRVVGSEAGGLYGKPITKFERWWLMCGSHVLFVVDRIEATESVRVTWNWLLNNRDDQLELKVVQPDRLVARRGSAGMKLFHLGGGGMGGPYHGMIHDAYHPLPGQLGEGRSGSGQLVRWTSANAEKVHTVVHAMALDSAGLVAGWHLRTEEGDIALQSPAGQRWALSVQDEAMGMALRGDGRQWRVGCDDGGRWGLEQV